MDKMKYEKPSAEIVLFANEDVITTSRLDICGNPSSNGGNGCPGNQKSSSEW